MTVGGWNLFGLWIPVGAVEIRFGSRIRVCSCDTFGVRCSSSALEQLSALDSRLEAKQGSRSTFRLACGAVSAVQIPVGGWNGFGSLDSRCQAGVCLGPGFQLALVHQVHRSGGMKLVDCEAIQMALTWSHRRALGQSGASLAVGCIAQICSLKSF